MRCWVRHLQTDRYINHPLIIWRIQRQTVAVISVGSREMRYWVDLPQIYVCHEYTNMKQNDLLISTEMIVRIMQISLRDLPK